MFFSIIAAVIRRRKITSFDELYAYATAVEFVDRVFLMANLWSAAKVITFSVCLLNITATGLIGIFFYVLYLEPIFTYSAHFGNLFRILKWAYVPIIFFSSIVGVNFTRLMYSGVLGLMSIAAGFTKLDLFVRPLNTMANFTLFFTVAQIII